MNHTAFHVFDSQRNQFTNTKPGTCEQGKEKLVLAFGLRDNALNFGRSKHWGPLITDCWRIEKVRVPLSRVELFAVRIYRAGNHRLDYLHIVGDRFCPKPHSIAFRFCNHFGNELLELPVFEIGKLAFPDFRIDVAQTALETAERVRFDRPSLAIAQTGEPIFGLLFEGDSEKCSLSSPAGFLRVAT
jgi:hypothetical protein